MTGFWKFFRLPGPHHLALSISALVLTSAGLWAAPFIPVDDIRFKNDAVILSTESVFPEPRWETWQSMVEDRPTQMIVIDLPDVKGDMALLKTRLGEIEKKNPQFTRLLALAMSNGNFRLVIEVAIEPGHSLSPRVEQLQKGEVVVFLDSPEVDQFQKIVEPLEDEGGQSMSASAEPSSVKEGAAAGNVEEMTRLNQHVVALTRELERLRQENAALVSSLNDLRKGEDSDPPGKRQAEKSKGDSSTELKKLQREFERLEKANAKLENRQKSLNEHLQASLEENIKLERKLEAARKGKPDPTADSAKMVQIATELQATMSERDDLEIQVRDLQKILSQQDRQISDLRHEISQQTSIIRGSDPALARMDLSDTTMNSNLRSALLRVATRLKQAEDEVARLKKAHPGGEPPGVAPKKIEADEPKGIFIAAGKKLIVEEDDQLHMREDTTARDRERERQLQQRIQENPKAYDAYLELESLYRRHRNYEAAEAVLQDLISYDPYHAPAYYELTQVYLMQEAPERALATLETYRRLNPSDAQRANSLESKIQSQLNKERRQ